ARGDRIPPPFEAEPLPCVRDEETGFTRPPAGRPDRPAPNDGWTPPPNPPQRDQTRNRRGGFVIYDLRFLIWGHRLVAQKILTGESQTPLQRPTREWMTEKMKNRKS